MNTRARGLGLLLAVGFFGSGISKAADPPPFSITISSPHENSKVGADVMVTIDVVNTSSQRVLLYTGPENGMGEVFRKVEVWDGRGNLLIRSPGGELMAGGSVKKKALMPGETLKERVIVSKIFDLSQAGKYTIRVQRRDESTKALVTSNTITITVEP